jgi:hypothetical protein
MGDPAWAVAVAVDRTAAQEGLAVMAVRPAAAEAVAAVERIQAVQVARVLAVSVE